jgi:coniferyl-aldehyde dehydrogenase
MSPAIIAERFEAQRQAFLKEPNPSYEARLSRLDRLLALTDANEAAIVAAIDADFSGRASQETRLAELFVVRAGINHARSHLRRWMRVKRAPTGLHFRPGYNRLMPQPLGVAGIVSPWNYPFQLAIAPALAALAAGNRVMLKPSELTPAFSALLDQLVSKTFDPDEVCVVTGDAETGKAFTALPFDHLFFTGSTQVGRIVAQAAAANLTPVTLELGGKSPAIFDPSCDVDVSVGRVAFGKLLNAGQTCIAPDYLMVPRGQADAVAGKLGAAISKMYPSLVDNPDYTAIISQRHRARLVELVDEAREKGARIVEVNPANERFESNRTRKLAPTLVINPAPDTRLMREEIFGPVLPILEYDGVDEAIARVRAGDHPLALYWFGNDAENRKRVLDETLSGGVTINDCLWHIGQEDQPFGGVGPSGMGAYHGEWGFNTFSKLKPVFHQSKLNGIFLFRPPYGSTFERILGLLKRLT